MPEEVEDVSEDLPPGVSPDQFKAVVESLLPLLRRAGGDFSRQFVQQAGPQLVQQFIAHLRQQGGVSMSGESNELAIEGLTEAIKQQTKALIDIRNVLDWALFVYDPDTGEPLTMVDSKDRSTKIPVGLARILYDDAFGDDEDDGGEDDDYEDDDPPPPQNSKRRRQVSPLRR